MVALCDTMSYRLSYLVWTIHIITQLPLKSIDFTRKNLILSYHGCSLKKKRHEDKEIRRLFGHLLGFTIRHTGDVYVSRHTCN